VKADLVKGKAAIRWSPVVMEAMQHQELIARTVFMVHDGGLGASYGRRKRHRQLGGRRVCTRHCRGNTLAKRRKALKLSVIRVASMLGQDTAIIDGIERCEWTLQAHVTQYERLLQDFERGEYH